MSSLKSYPSLVHFLGTGFVARARFCAVALLALLWVAQPASAQTPDLSGTTTPLPVTPGGDAVVVFPDLVVSDADANPVVMRVRVENPNDLNAGDTMAFSGTPNTNGFQLQFFTGAEILGAPGNDTFFAAFASSAAGTADNWHDLLRNLTFAAPAGSGEREIRLFVQVRYTASGSDSPDTLTRTLNIGAPAANSPPTGLPTITGTPRVGVTLTANTSGISDADGPDPLPFTYQWNTHAGGTDTAINNATSATYLLTADEMGDQITVSVRYTDAGNTNEGPLTSVPTAAVAMMSPLELSGTTTPLPVTPGGAPVAIFPDLSIDTGRPNTFRLRVESAANLNSGDAVTLAAAAERRNYDISFIPIASVGASQNIIVGVSTPDNDDEAPERWHNLLRHFTFQAPAGSGGREVRFIAELTVSDLVSGNDVVRTLTRTLNIGAAAANSPPTGLPTITGTPRVGETLTAETGAIADANGLANATFTYQWLGNDGNLSGQTLQTLALTSLNLGTDISVRVRFTDDDGFNETLTSTEVTVEAATTNSPPTGRPTVAGLFAQGQELTAATTNVDDADGLPAVSTFRYQWHTNDSTTNDPGTNTPIVGATMRTYTLTEDEVGLRIGVTVSYTDLGTPPADESVTNTFLPLVTGPAAPLVADAGADQVVNEGALVTLDASGSSSDAPGPLFYVWGQDDNSGHEILLVNPFAAQQAFPAPTGLSEDAELIFLLGVSDTSGEIATDEVRVRVRAAASAANNPPTGRLTIDGDPRSGQTLTANTSDIGDADGLPATGTAGAFTYQWFAEDDTTNAEIAGATDPSYLLTDAQIDARISLVLRYTDGLGVAERVTSLAVGPVVPVNSAPVAVIAPIDPALLLTEGDLTGLDGGISTTLDGSGSSDPDGDELTYLWSFSSAVTATPGGTVPDNSIATPVLTISQRQSFADILTISLTVTDPDGLEDTATVEYVLLPETPIPNRHPNADPQPSTQTVFSGDTVTLDGSNSSDPDLGQTATLIYRWRHIQNSFFGEIPLDGAGTPIASFTAPPSTSDTNINTTNGFELTVTDTAGASDTREVLVNIRPNSPPTGEVRITGIPLLGATLTANTDTLDDPDGLPDASTFAYQWQRNGVDIAGATERSYLPTADDAGELITVTVSYEDTATPTGGKNESLRSDPVGPVSGVPPVVITGTPTQGEVLTADTSGIDDNPRPGSVFAYQWFANDGTTNAEIAGATNRTYLLSQAEVGQRITLRVNYTNANGAETGPLTSTPTAAVAEANVGPSGVVRIDGRAAQGGTLTADTSAITDGDGPDILSFTYQWNTHESGANTPISGETTASYTLSADDVGEQISVSVRYTDAENNAEGPLTSAPTAAVVGPDLSGTTTRLTVVPGGAPVVMFPDISVRGTPNTIRIRVLNPEDLDAGDGTALGAGDRTGYTVFFGTGAGAGSGTPHLLFNATANTSGTSEPDRWQGLLRHITFSAPAATGGRQLQLIADVSFDGTTYTSSTLSRTLNISANNAPTSSGLTATLDEDDSHTFAADQFGFDDADSGNTLQQVRIDTLPDSADGSLALDGTAVTAEQVIPVADIPNLVYTPATNVNGQATFTFSVSDGTDFSDDVATASLTVDAVNDPPSGTVTIAGTPVRGQNLTANTFAIEDVEGPNVLPFTYQWNRDDGTTTEAISGATSVIYTLTEDDVDAQITVSVEYTDAEGTDEGPLTSAPTAAILGEFHTISLTGESGTVDEGDTAFFTVTLTAAPQSPFQIFYTTSIENDDSAEENDFTPTSGVLGFASNNNLTAGITVPITADSEVEDNETFTLTLTVADGSTLPPTFILNPSATSARATITGSAGSNTPPTSTGLTATLVEDGSHTFAASQFGFADTDSGDTLQQVRIDSLPDSANGSLALGGTAVSVPQEIAVGDIGTLVYTPVANANGDATFTFSVSDGDDFSTTPATATLTVTAVNDPATGGAVIGDDRREGATLTADISTIEDADGVPTDASAFSYQWLGLSLVPIANANSATYTLTEDNVGGPIYLEIRFTDLQNNAEDLLLAALGGLPVVGRTNTPPTTSGLEVTVFENTPYTFAAGNPGFNLADDFNFNDVDIGDSLQQVRIDSLPAPANLGDLRLNGTPVTVDQVIAVGDIPTLIYTPAADTTGTVTFTFSVSDGDDFSAPPATGTLNIVTTDSPPTSSGLAVTAFEGTRHNFALAEFNFADEDGATLHSLRIDSLPAAGLLSLNNTPVIAGQVIPVHQFGILFYHPAMNSAGTVDTFTYSVFDGTDFSAESATATLNIVSANTNIPPSTSGLAVMTAEDTPYTFAAGNFNFDDANSGDNLVEVRIDTLPASTSGSLALNGTPVTAPQVIAATAIPNLVYTPVANVNGDATFTFSVSDGTAFSTAPATATVTVTPVNDPPTTGNLTATIAEDTTHTFAADDFPFTDDDGDSLAEVRIDTLPASADGSLALGTSATPVNPAQVIPVAAIPTLVYTPALNANGNATFTFSVSDGTAFSTPPATATVTVTAVNDAPTTSNLTATIAEDNTHTFAAADFTFNDVDSGDTLQQVRIDSLPASDDGSLALGTGTSATPVNPAQVITVADIPTLVYTPVTNVNGAATFTFSVSDGAAFSATPATATVTVTAVNDPPTTSNLTATIAEDNTHTFAAADFTFNDVDSGDNLTAVRIDTLPDSTDGSLALGTGTSATPVNPAQVIAVADIPTLVYTPVDNVNGDATFTFSVSDGTAFSAATGTATVTVTPVNDPPTISGLPDKTVVQGQDYSFTPRGDDVDGDTLEYAITNMPSWASFDETTGALTGTPASTDVANYENIVISVTDNIITTPVALNPFAIAVTATATTNTPPTADAGLNQRVSKGTEVTLDGTGSDDPDGDNSALIYLWERTAGPTEVTLSNEAASQPTFTIPTVIPTNPASYTFRLTVNDGQATSALDTVRIFIRPLFQATITNQNFTADTAITPITLPEARDGPDSLPSTNTYTLTPVPLPAGLAFNATSRILSGTPTQAGTFDLTYTATNQFTDTDSLSFSITVTSAANNPPTTSGLTVSTNEDIAHTFAAAQFNFADTDSGDSLTAVRIDSLPAGANGSLALNGTAVAVAQVIPVADIPTLVYTPATNVNGDATFTFSVSDGTDFSATPATATVTVTPVNDPPSGLPTISGTPRVGNTLTANTGGISDADGLANATFTYRWLEDGGTLSGETSPTLALTATNLGADIEVRVSFTDDAGNNERLTSDAVSIGAAVSETVSIAGPTGNVNEGDNATFTVTLSGSPGAAVVVDYATAAGTATAGDDFTTTSGTLTFAAGATGDDLSQTFDVPVLTDSLVEGDESFTATLSANASTPLPTGFSLGTATTTATIGAAGTATVSIAGPTGNVNEGDDATFTVTLSGSPGAAVVVDYATAIGTASATDFSDTSGTLTFAANTTTLSQTFDVPVTTDSLVEGSETFTATLSANSSNPLPTGFSLGTATATATIGATSSATVSISGGGNVAEGDDATFTVTLSGSPGAAVVVDYATVAGTATAGSDFTETTGTLTFAANSTDLTRTFTVTTNQDDLAEGSETFTVTLSANATSPLPTGFTLGTATATATIAASDAATLSIEDSTGTEDDGNVTFTVTLSGGATTADVVVEYATSRAVGDSAATSDFTATNGTLTFAARASGADGTETFSVSVANDTQAEGDETFTVTLSQNATSPLPAGVSLGTATAQGTITANDGVTVSIENGTGTEDDGNVTFTVALTGSPGAEVVVSYDTSVEAGDSAVAGDSMVGDFTTTNGTLTFAAGASGDDLMQTFTVSITDDNLAEGNETFTATLSANAASPLPPGVTLGTATAQGTIEANDGAMLSIDGGTGAEDADATFTVRLSGGTIAEAVVVNYATSVETGDSAVAGDFTNTTGTLTFAAGASGNDLMQTFTVPVSNDSLAEGPETFTATLGGTLPPGVSLNPSATSAQWTIEASDAAMVSIEDGTAGTEGTGSSGNATFTVTLSGSPGAAVVVNYDTSVETGDSAVAGDFTDTTGTLTFAANTTTLTQTFTVPVTNDVLAEGDETFTATLSQNATSALPANVTLGTTTAQGTIAANDPAMLSIEDATGTEGANATFTVTLSGSPGAAVVVSYDTSVETGDSAVAGDFSDTSGTLTFAAATTTLSQTFTVPITDDTLAEGDETFTATLSGALPPGVTLNPSATNAQGTIAANDGAMLSIADGNGVEGGDATFTVALSGSPGAEVVVNYATSVASGDSAVAGDSMSGDFTTTNGTLTFAVGASGAALSQTFSVPITEDNLAEGPETFTATLSGSLPAGVTLGTATAQGTIAASDGATLSIADGTGGDEGDNATFTVTLSGGETTAAVVVNYATSLASGDTAETSDFTETNGTLTFAAGASGSALSQTFTVPLEDDDLAEDSETFTATLSGTLPPGVSLDPSATSAQATIAASDAATVFIAGPSGTVLEGDNAEFTVSLSGPSEAAVVVNYATATGTASASDFTDTSGTLTFVAGASGNDLSQTIMVSVSTDSLVEGAETFTMALSANTASPLPPSISLGTATATATIAVAGSATVSISGPSGLVSEDTDATFTVTLSGSPGANVVVDYATSVASGDTATASDFTDTSGTLTFATGASGDALSQTIPVRVNSDSLVEGAEAFTVTLTENTASPLPTVFSLSTATATATIAPSGSALVSISGGGNVAEGTNATFTVTLTGSPGSAVMVDYATATGTAAANDFTATNGTLTFAVGASGAALRQTFDVPVSSDNRVEGDETFTATLSGMLPAGFGLGTATETATITAAGTATVSISGGGNVAEGANASFTVTLTGSPGSAVLVDYRAEAGSAAGNDFTPTSGTLTFAADTTDLTQTFMVMAETDDRVEGNESFMARLSANSGSPLPTGFMLDTATQTATITAEGMATVSISGGGNVVEGANASFTVTLSAPPGANVVVDYATAAGTASTNDFTATTGTLTFAADTTTLTQNIPVPVRTDNLVEGDETFTVTLSASSTSPLPTGFSLDTATQTATITGMGMATVSISGGGDVAEGADASFTVTLSAPPGAEVVVDYATAAGTASTNDFTETSGTLTFAADTSTLSQTFDVPVLTDMRVEGNESFTATLSANALNPLPTGFTLGTAPATATITAMGMATVSISSSGNVAEGDDATFTVTLSASPGANVVVDYRTEVGTAAMNDFTATNGTLTFDADTTTLSQSVTVMTTDDARVEGDENFTVILSANTTSPLPTGFTLGMATAMATIGAAGSATVAISGGGNIAEGANATFTVTLSASPGAAVVVDYATAAGTAAAGSDFTTTSGTLTFAAGVTGTDLSQTFTVPVLTDSFVEGDESFTATLSANASNPLPTGFSLGTATATATITAMGMATVSISGGGNVAEGANATFTVTLSASPGSAVLVDYAAAGDTASTDDFEATSGTLTFAAGATNLTQTFTVSVTDDDLVEGDETFTATLSANTSSPLPTGFSLGTATATATIAENDVEARIADLNNEVLPEVASAVAGLSVGGITHRINQVRDGANRTVNFAGQSSLAGVASAHGQGMSDGTLDMKDMLGNSSFALPLNAADGTSGISGSSLTFWGGGDYRDFEGSGNGVDFDGDLFSAQLGVDGKPRDDLLIGLAASWSESEVEYQGGTDLRGEHQLDITSLHPYASWEARDGLDLWGTVGYGQGELEITNEGQDPIFSDVELRTVGVGVDYQLPGSGIFRLKSSALLSELEVEGGDGIAALEVSTSLLRMALEGSHKQKLSGGAYMEPSFEAGARYDGGDGKTGVGAELGVGLRYANPAVGLTLESNARTLVGRDDYKEWGVSGRILLQAGSHGRGLSFSMSPVYGNINSSTQALWDDGLRDETNGTARDNSMRMESRLGYGLSAPGGHGLLTPYAELTSGDSTRRYRLGMSWELGSLFDLNLVGERSESSASGASNASTGSTNAEHLILLKGVIRL